MSLFFPPADVFFSLSLSLMVASLLETLLITHIHFHSSQYRVAPRWLSVLMLQYISVVVCVPPQKRHKRTTVSLPDHIKGKLTSLLLKLVSINTFDAASHFNH